MPHSLERIVAWKKAVELAESVRAATRRFPDVERFELSPQLRRSSTSVASNIAEGYGRLGTKDYARFLGIARGSAYEVFTQLTIARRAGYAVNEALFERVEEILRLLNSSINSLGDRAKEEETPYGCEAPSSEELGT